MSENVLALITSMSAYSAFALCLYWYDWKLLIILWLLFISRNAYVAAKGRNKQ